MNTNYCKQQSIKFLGFIILACFSLFLSSCGTENDENFEMPSEEVLEKVAAATQVVDQLFSESSSIDEFEKRLDEIRNTEGVVDAYTDSQTMYVEYEALGIVVYYYPIYPNVEDEKTSRSFNAIGEDLPIKDIIKNISTRTSETNEFIENVHHKLNKSEQHSLVIYNALYNDYAVTRQLMLEMPCG